MRVTALFVIPASIQTVNHVVQGLDHKTLASNDQLHFLLECKTGFFQGSAGQAQCRTVAPFTDDGFHINSP